MDVVLPVSVSLRGSDLRHQGERGADEIVGDSASMSSTSSWKERVNAAVSQVHAVSHAVSEAPHTVNQTD